MSVLVGKKAPLSQSQAVLANGEIIDDFHLGQTISGKYAALFFSVGFHVCLSLRNYRLCQQNARIESP